MSQNSFDQLTKEQFNKYKDLLLEIIQRHLPDVKVYLFGSRARNQARSGSDIDLMLDAGTEIDRLVMMHIKNDVEESRVPFFVDVVDMHDASQEFKNFIRKDLVLWKN